MASTTLPPRKRGERMSAAALQALPARKLTQGIRMMNRTDFGGEDRQAKIIASLPPGIPPEFHKAISGWAIALLEKQRQGTARRQRPYEDELDRRNDVPNLKTIKTVKTIRK